MKKYILIALSIIGPLLLVIIFTPTKSRYQDSKKRTKQTTVVTPPKIEYEYNHWNAFFTFKYYCYLDENPKWTRYDQESHSHSYVYLNEQKDVAITILVMHGRSNPFRELKDINRTKYNNRLIGTSLNGSRYALRSDPEFEGNEFKMRVFLEKGDKLCAIVISSSNKNNIYRAYEELDNSFKLA